MIKRIPILILALFGYLFSISQALITYDTVIAVSGGANWNARITKPAGYNINTARTYPLIVDFQGIGEVGTNPALMSVAGANSAIQRGGWKGYELVGTDTVRFIVVTLQPPSAYPDETAIQKRLDRIKLAVRYSTIHFTGYSQGGWNATTFVTGDPYGGPYTYASQIKSVITIEGVVPSDNAPFPDLWDNYANVGGRLAGFEQRNDFMNMPTYINRMNAKVPNSAIYTQTFFGAPAYNHCCWDNFYGGTLPPTDTFLLDGNRQNIYKWMARVSLATANQLPTVSAGSNQSITLPTNSVTLTGTANDPDGAIAVYAWTKYSGVASGTIISPASASTTITGLAQGIYKYQLTVTDNNGGTAYSIVQVTVNGQPIPPVNANIGTANDPTTYVPYTDTLKTGTNLGYYSSYLSEKNTARLSYNAGARTLRLSLPDRIITPFGVNVRLSEWKFYVDTLGMSKLTVFLGEPAPANLDTTTFPGCDAPSKIFKGIYEDPWLDPVHTVINPDNTLANYIYKVVGTYGSRSTFFEIVNEPDFTYAAEAYYPKTNPTAWWNVNPTANQLQNLKAPIYYYIRYMRVAWEVIKAMRPTAYVCTGGVGYPSFMDAILRQTDNPVDGSVTTQYPFSAGAYFDVVSYHDYPMYQPNSPNIFPFVKQRYSDSAVDLHIAYKTQYDSVLLAKGYGSTYPPKQYITTETDLARQTVGLDWGTVDAANNYIIKLYVYNAINGIKECYKYGLGEGGEGGGANNIFNWMGVYGDLTPSFITVANAPKNPQFVPFKTVGMLLSGKIYDSLRTAQLQLSGGYTGIRGGAFKDTAGKYTYILWAKTYIDLNETASGAYTFSNPQFAGIKREWDFSQTGNSTTVGRTVSLTGYPSFITEAAPQNKIPVVNAGVNQTITLPTNSVTLTGVASDTDGVITAYQWVKLSGGTATITTPSLTSTTVTGLVAGVYQFQLLVTDNLGATKKDTVQITVNAAPVIARLVVNAGADQIITGVTSTTLTGTFTGGVAPYTYLWTKTSCASGTISSPYTLSTSITNLAKGTTHTFILTVTDSRGISANDGVKVKVN